MVQFDGMIVGGVIHLPLAVGGLPSNLMKSGAGPNTDGWLVATLASSLRPSLMISLAVG